MTEYEEIPNATDRSFVMLHTFTKLVETGAPYMVGQFARGCECITYKAETYQEAVDLAVSMDEKTGCWSCICDDTGVIWQAFVAMVEA